MLPVTRPLGDINLPLGRKRKRFHMSASACPERPTQKRKRPQSSPNKRAPPRSLSVVGCGLSAPTESDRGSAAGGGPHSLPPGGASGPRGRVLRSPERPRRAVEAAGRKRGGEGEWSPPRHGKCTARAQQVPLLFRKEGPPELLSGQPLARSRMPHGRV